jgi:hypothetical protein
LRVTSTEVAGLTVGGVATSSVLSTGASIASMASVDEAARNVSR